MQGFDQAAKGPILPHPAAIFGPAPRKTPRRPLMSDKVTHVGDADFDAAVLQSDEPVLVDFWAEWCGPCKMIAPVLDELADSYSGRLKIVKLNVDENRATAIKYHVRNIPLLLLFKDGQVQATQVGAVGKGQLTQLIDKTIGAAAA
jgi:thioredoxin 1